MQRRKERLTGMWVGLKGYHWQLESRLEDLRNSIELLEEEGDAYLSRIREEREMARARLGSLLSESVK